ncbi:MAG: hypothetical protein RMN51_03285 [Verrucomicrobiota bacterium]|nr:hypothetical protein [Limisphaera sp.]MDW8381123.1 hypothetical protein [Verrucomicrobiota bacterium]
MPERRKWDVDLLIATVLPSLLLVFFALPCIIRKRTFGWYGAPPRTGEEAVMSGLGAVGLALFIHAYYMPMYRRFPVLR